MSVKAVFDSNARFFLVTTCASVLFLITGCGPSDPQSPQAVEPTPVNVTAPPEPAVSQPDTTPRAPETPEPAPAAAEPEANAPAPAPPAAESKEAESYGRWRKAHTSLPDVTDAQAEEIEQLEAIGYLSGYKEAPSQDGILVHDGNAAYQGVNLVVSGHEPYALLMKMDGTPLHRWGRRFDEVWPDRNVTDEFHQNESWRRAYLYPNGDLLAIYEGYGIVKVDKSSEVIWAQLNKAHHDLHVAEDGRIYTLTRQGRMEPRFHPDRPILEDFITVLSPEGETLQSTSILKCIENSPFASMLDFRQEHGDLLHTNTIQLIETVPEPLQDLFKPGQVLVSLLMLNTAAVIDLDAETVVWAVGNMWTRQHEPMLLPDGTMLVFDNLGRKKVGDPVGRSKAVRIDPLTLRVTWQYPAPDVTDPLALYSATCGSLQVLPNGNTLITESDNGRALEVTTDGTIAWEFVSPFRAGPNKELVATLYDVVRFAPDFPIDWADEATLKP